MCFAAHAFTICSANPADTAGINRRVSTIAVTQMVDVVYITLHVTPGKVEGLQGLRPRHNRQIVKESVRYTRTRDHHLREWSVQEGVVTTRGSGCCCYVSACKQSIDSSHTV